MNGDDSAAWLEAEQAARDAYGDAYWRTIAYDTGAELAPTISPDGPHVDYAGHFIPNPDTGEGSEPT